MLKGPENRYFRLNVEVEDLFEYNIFFFISVLVIIICKLLIRQNEFYSLDFSVVCVIGSYDFIYNLYIPHG